MSHRADIAEPHATGERRSARLPSRAPRAFGIHPLLESVQEKLKADCDLKRRLLVPATDSAPALADQAVASRLVSLCKAARVRPSQAVSTWLSVTEWEALWCLVHQLTAPPRTPPSVRRAVGWLEQLGGGAAHGDANTDPVALWHGLHRLNDLTAMWRLCRNGKSELKGNRT